MKYILVETEDAGHAPILFDDAIAHDEMANGVPKKIKVKSAGFVKLTKNDGKLDIECYGHSVSLGISSRPEQDTFFVKLCLLRTSSDEVREEIKKEMIK